MTYCVDQPYDTVRLVEMLIDAACSHQPKAQLQELVSWFLPMHPVEDYQKAERAIQTLASEILYVVDSFQSRLSDRRFPYVRIPAPANLAALEFYVMRRFEVDLDSLIQP